MKLQNHSPEGWSISQGKTTVRAFPHPLEMEKAGKTFRGNLEQGPRGTYAGKLSDEKGDFLSCQVRFRKKVYGGMEIVEETRTYRARRDLSRTLLTLRYFLDPVEKASDGFLVIPALWYGDNEAWARPMPFPKGLNKDWNFRADGSSCPAVVWTTPRGSYSVAIDNAARFPVPRPGWDAVLGIGFTVIAPSRHTWQH